MSDNAGSSVAGVAIGANAVNPPYWDSMRLYSTEYPRLSEPSTHRYYYTMDRSGNVVITGTPEAPALDQHDIVFTDKAGNDLIRLCPDGTIAVRGRDVDDDAKLVEAMREFLTLSGFRLDRGEPVQALGGPVELRP